MSVDRWRWAQKASQLRFQQVEVVRRQAETWRTGLAGATGLLAAVLVVKGRDNLTGLSPGYRWAVALLFGAALAALVAATLCAIRAASGTPGDECLLTGQELERWSRQETRAAQRAIRTARLLTLAGIAAIATAVGVAWLAPAAEKQGAMVVETQSGRDCGTFGGAIGGKLLLRTSGQEPKVIPLAEVVRLESVAKCP